MLLLGAWVMASPWIWGYDDVPGAVATDIATGGAVMALTLLGIARPPFNALLTVAGLWLVLAPWIVGYGDVGGPVGLSDALAGILIAALAVARLASASRQAASTSDMPVGRIRRSREPPQA